MSNSPKFTDSIYTKNIAKLTKMEAFKNGDATKLLTKWERESDDGYKARQETSVLYNVVSKTIGTATGMIFRKEITWSDDINQLFATRTEDIDNQDTELNEFLKDCAMTALWDGISYILVDIAKNDEPIASFQQQLERGIVPYFTKVTSKQILNRRYDKGVLTQITIDENITVPDGEFGEKEINQQRVLFIGGGRIYQGEGVVYEWTNNLSFIPLIPVYTKKTGYLQGEPKFLDLANLNVKHYNLSSQLDKSLFVAGNPIPVVYGRKDEEAMTIGVDQALMFGSKDEGGFEWVEFAGTSIDKQQEEIANVEKRMNALALSVLTQRDGDITATEAAINASGETSDLSAIASSIEWSANLAYSVWCDMMGQQTTGEIKVNRDFVGIALTPEQANTYLAMYTAGTLTLEQLWNELQRGEFIMEFDRDIAKAEIEAKNQDVGL